MAAVAKNQEATAARLDRLTVPSSGQWAAETREATLSRLREMGLPERRDEYWKYTRPDTLTQADAPAAAVYETGEAPLFDRFDRIKVVFVDGHPDANYELMVSMMDTVRASGAERLGIASLKEGDDFRACAPTPAAPAAPAAPVDGAAPVPG